MNGTRKFMSGVLLLRERYANRTALDIANVLHGQQSATARVLQKYMIWTGLNFTSSNEQLEVTNRLDNMGPSKKTISSKIFTTYNELASNIKGNFTISSDWKTDGFCSSIDLQSGVSSKPIGYIEYHGMPSPTKLKAMISSGKPLLLRQAVSALNISNNLWSRHDILSRYGQCKVLQTKGGGELQAQEQMTSMTSYIASFMDHDQAISQEEIGYVFTALKAFEDNCQGRLIEDISFFEKFINSIVPFRNLPDEVCIGISFGI